MAIDDRLRGTYQRQLRQVEDRVASSRTDMAFKPARPRLAPRLVLAGAFVVLVAAGAFATSRFVGDPVVPLDAGETGSASSSLAPEPSTPQTTTPTTAPSTTGPSLTATSESPDTTEAETAETETSQTMKAQPAEVVLSGGVVNSVCPSGARAELEWAALRYIGDSRGWGRMDDLVDEQEGPYYFQAWEPNFEEPVTVEITLVDPVLATEIRVAQDPFTKVAGNISIVTADQTIDRTIDLELSGIGGWRVHEYAAPTLLRSFTITRSIKDSNIMEVMICVVPDP